MKSLRLLLPLTLIAALSACGGKGSSAPAPAHFEVEAQDTQLHMTWSAVPGVEYWVWCAPGASTIDSHSPSATHSGWLYYTKIFSGEYYATGLNNGTQYACTVNGRYDGGPGGADATPQVVTPRAAGAAATWHAGASTALTSFGSTQPLRSVAYGLLSTMSTTTDQFVAVGANGQIAVSTSVAADVTMAWAAPTQAAGVGTPFNAVTFYPYSGGYRFVAAGGGGQVAYALNASTWTWTAATTGSSANVNALAASAGAVVAVGDSGYIGTSSGGATWSTQTSNTTNALRAVAFAPLVNGSSTSYWIAVGDAGTLLKSTDASTWSVVSSGTAQNLTGVAVLPVTNSSTSVTTYILAAVGDAGTLLVSTDHGATWSAASTVSPATSLNFVSVAAGKGLIMAVDASGNVYSSTNGSSWTGSASGLSSAVQVLRYTPTPTPSYLATKFMTAFSNGWLVFDASGNQRIAR